MSETSQRPLVQDHTDRRLPMLSTNDFQAKSGFVKFNALVAAAALFVATASTAIAGRGSAPEFAGSDLEPGTNFSTASQGTEVSRTPFQYFSLLQCDGNACFVELLSMPRRKRLEIRDISCTISASDQGNISNASMSVNKGPEKFAVRYLIPQLKSSASNFRSYGINRQGYFIVEPRTTLDFSVQTSTKFVGSACSLTGDLVKLK